MNIIATFLNESSEITGFDPNEILELCMNGASDSENTSRFNLSNANIGLRVTAGAPTHHIFYNEKDNYQDDRQNACKCKQYHEGNIYRA